jgi:hypothetical protein
VLGYPLYGLSSILVRFLGYPLEVIDQCIFNFLVGFSFNPIIIPNFQDFVVGSSFYGGSMKELGISLPFL